MNPTVYIETTIISYLTARPTRDLIRQAQQQITQEWWESRDRYDLYTSALVVAEASQGDANAAAARMAVLRTLRPLRILPQADELAESLVTELAIPLAARRDAVHVAIAATNGIDYLLTWNCRHLANLHQRARIERVCREHGYQPPLIGTPNELLEDVP